MVLAAAARSVVGRRSNRDVVGAVITVCRQDDGRPVTRWVSRSSGFNSSLPKQRLVGLRSREAPYDLEVRWPSGEVHVLTIDSSGTQTEVVEPV